MSHSSISKISWLGGRYGVLFLTFVACLFLVAIWIYQLWQGRERTIASAKINTANLVRIIEEANNRTIQAVDLILTNVATVVKQEGCSDDLEANIFLQSLLNESPQVREVAFADKTGQITTMSRRGAPDFLTIENEKYFSKALEGTLSPFYISGPRPGRLLGEVSQNYEITGLWHLIMARAVYNADSTFLGVALAVINPGFFQEQIQGLDLGTNSYVSYYRYDGKLLVTSKLGFLHLGSENHANQALFTQYLTAREWGTFVQAAKEGSDATYIISYRATSRWPLLVTVGLDQDEVLATWRLEAEELSIVTLGILIVLVALAIMVYYQHVTQEKMAQKLVEANHDSLTGLPALRLCKDRLFNALSRARRENSVLAVFFIDLDGFKEINDNHGHDAGDHVLKQVAKRLKSSVREMDTVARLGGDEFLIMLPKINDKYVIERIGDNIIKSLQKSIQWQENMLSVSASIGIALHPEHGDEPEQLIKKADSAMYEAKRNGKNQYVIVKL